MSSYEMNRKKAILKQFCCLININVNDVDNLSEEQLDDYYIKVIEILSDIPVGDEDE